nr:ribonuclease H-like domain-containing protein [Tanacetum cinerariifolium]
MESLSPQVVSTAKLPILNPNEFDLWKMRIEQYFLMTDYSLWEVILNGDSPAPTRVIECVLQPVAPTTAEQRLARKNKLKAHGTLLMALPNKHQLKFNTHKDAKTLMEAIEKRFGGNTENKKVQKTLLKQQYENFTGSSSESLDKIHDRLLPSDWRTHTLIWRNKTDLEEQSLDDLLNNLKIYEAEVKSSSSASTTTQNIAFMSSSNTDSTNEPISVVVSIFVVSAKIHVVSLPNVDSLSFDMSKVECYNCHRKGHFARECSYDWSFQAEEDPTNYALMAFSSSSSSSNNEMAMLTMRARRFLQRTLRNLGANGPTSMGFDMSKVECYNCHRKGHFSRKCSYDWSFQAEEEPANYALMAFSSSSSSSDNELRDNALVSLRKTLKKAEQERDDLKLKLEKFQTSSKNLTELLASQTNAKTCLGYNSQVFTCAMFDCDDYLSSGSDESFPPSPIYDRYQSCNGYHAIPPSYTRTFMPPKHDLVFNNAPNDVETDHPAFTIKLSPTKLDQDLSHTIKPSSHIIED